jgi:hypothetical protein
MSALSKRKSMPLRLQHVAARAVSSSQIQATIQEYVNQISPPLTLAIGCGWKQRREQFSDLLRLFRLDYHQFLMNDMDANVEPDLAGDISDMQFLANIPDHTFDSIVTMFVPATLFYVQPVGKKMEFNADFIIHLQNKLKEGGTVISNTLISSMAAAHWIMTKFTTDAQKSVSVFQIHAYLTCDPNIAGWSSTQLFFVKQLNDLFQNCNIELHAGESEIWISIQTALPANSDVRSVLTQTKKRKASTKKKKR